MLQKLEPVVQLMRAQWFPASASRPQTVVTIRTLRLFHAFTIQGKVNAYDFYHGLARITDGAGLIKPKVSVVVRQQLSAISSAFRRLITSLHARFVCFVIFEWQNVPAGCTICKELKTQHAVNLH
jgi:hypothetical protein